MTPFERVLAEPGSTAARRALLQEWQTLGDPRAELLAKQLELAGLSYTEATSRWRALREELRDLIATRGRELAGPISGLVEGFELRRGLVARVQLSGTAWVIRAPYLLSLAPVQEVHLTAPLGDLDALFAVPELSRVVVLDLSWLDSAFGDAGALALARSPYSANLRSIDLMHCAIGEAGVEALAASPYLEQARYLNFADNPCNPTPTFDDHDGFRVPRRAAIAGTLEDRFGRRPWLTLPSADDTYPPDADWLCVSD